MGQRFCFVFLYILEFLRINVTAGSTVTSRRPSEPTFCGKQAGISYLASVGGNMEITKLSVWFGTNETSSTRFPDGWKGKRKLPVAARRNKAAESSRERDMLRRPFLREKLFQQLSQVARTLVPSCPSARRRRPTATARPVSRTLHFVAPTFDGTTAFTSTAQVITGFLLPEIGAAGGRDVLLEKQVGPAERRGPWHQQSTVCYLPPCTRQLIFSGFHFSPPQSQKVQPGNLKSVPPDTL